jgi:hypothetical protein
MNKCNNPGQPIEMVCRIFFEQDQEEFTVVKEYDASAGQLAIATKILADSERLEKRFERFESFLDREEKAGHIKIEKKMERSARIVFFALGCEMMTRRIERFSAEEVLNIFIPTHCGLRIAMQYREMKG